MKKVIIIAVLCLVSHVRAQEQQKGGQALVNRPVKSHTAKADADVPASQAVPSNVFSYGKTAQSHIKSLGQVGKTARYEIVSVRVRGLDSPNLSAFLIYDSDSDQIVGMQSAGAPGLGVALVNGGANVAGSFLFGHSIRPDHNVNNSVAGAISQNSNKNESTAAGGTGNGGSGGAGGAGGTGNGGAGGSAGNHNH